MNNREIIGYIKIREAGKDGQSGKARAKSSIISGLIRFGAFLAYGAVEKFFLYKEIEEMYQQNPNYKYIFYLSLAFGLGGILDALGGAYNYFQASQQAEQLRKQVENLEKELS